MKKRLFLLLGTFVSLCAFAQRPVAPKPPGTMRVMSYNIRSGRGMDNKMDLPRTAEVINRVSPDVIALQEVDSATARSGGIDVLTELANRTSMYPVYGPAIDLQGGKYGVGVLSVEKPLSHKCVPLPGREEKRALLVVEFEGYVFCCTHFSLTEQDRLASVGIILDQVAGYNKPVILAGDLNDAPASACTEQLLENWKMLSDPEQPTFPANRPKETIDYIMALARPDYAFAALNAVVDDEAVASDHRPLFVDLRMSAVAGK